MSVNITNNNIIAYIQFITDFFRFMQRSQPKNNILSFQECKREQIVFKVQMKMNNKKKQLQVYSNDTHISLAQRFCQSNGLNIDKQTIDAVQYKIMTFLKNMLTNQIYDQKLRVKIRKFVNRYSYTDSQPKLNQQSSNKNAHLGHSKQKQTPFKLIQNQSCLNSNKYTGKRNRIFNNNDANNSNMNNSNNIENIIKYSKQANKNKKQQSLTKMINKVSIDKQKSNKKWGKSIFKNKTQVADKQLIKAYQVIYNKANQKQMKNMAKKFLQENGITISSCLSNQITKNISTIQPTKPKQKSMQKQPIKQQGYSQNDNNCDPFISDSQNISHKFNQSDNGNPKRLKYCYLEELPYDISLGEHLANQVSQFQITKSKQNKIQNSIIHKLDRSYSNSRNKIKYNIDQFSIPQEVPVAQSNIYRRKGNSISSDRLWSHKDYLNYKYQNEISQNEQRISNREHRIREKGRRYSYLD